MNPSSDPFDEISLQDVVEKLYQSLGGQTGGPTLERAAISMTLRPSWSFPQDMGRSTILPPSVKSNGC